MALHGRFKSLAGKISSDKDPMVYSPGRFGLPTRDHRFYPLFKETMMNPAFDVSNSMA